MAGTPLAMHSLMQLVIVLLVSGTHGKRLLVVLTPGCHSHLMGMKRMATEVSGRGHDVMVSRQKLKHILRGP